MTSRLMVIIPDRISDLALKGELVDRYYNPGDLFDEVHLVLVNDDDPPADALRKLVGRADPHVHRLPTSPRLFVRSVGWRPRLLRPWTEVAVDLAARVQPHLVRCHGAHLNALAARAVKQRLGIPYLVSLHINPDEDLRLHPVREGTARQRLALRASRAVERAALTDADCVVCVYRFIVPYAERMGARRVEVVYNVVNPGIVTKQDYSLSDPPRLILVGRQFSKKDPAPVIEAVSRMPEVELTLVGDGPLHLHLVELAKSLGAGDRVRFLASMANDELASALHTYDVALSVNDYGGVSKVELEAALAGMPIVTNAHPLEDRPEVLGDHCVVVEDRSPAAWKSAIERLLGDEVARAEMGRKVRQAVAVLEGSRSERRYADLYRQLARV